MNFTGKRVLVTGGTRGIGRATVEAFLAVGARVAVNGSSAASVSRVLAELKAGERAVGAPGDLGIVAECRRVVEGAVAALGGLDVLVNNAGVGEGAAIDETDEALWDRVIDINLKGAFFCIKFALPALRMARGSIVNVASILALHGHGFGSSPYCASKGGLVAITRELAIELGPDIRVNCLCPGAIDTDMLQGLGQFLGDGDITAGYQVLARAAALNRLGRSAEMANVVRFLASEHASFVTGAIYVADGGVTANMSGGRVMPARTDPQSAWSTK